MRNFDLKGKNKYYTLYKNVREEILSGRIKAGERLPSKRALAQECGVSVITVELAYEQLLAEGYITSRERSGYFAEKVIGSPQPVSANSATANAPSAPRLYTAPNPAAQYKIDLVKGASPAGLFPFATWAKLMRTVLADCGEHLLERVPCCGDGELRQAVSAYLYRARGIEADPEHIVIGAGAEHLYGILVFLLGRGKTFAVENPGYGKISSAYALYGAQTLPVSVISAGICLDEVQNSNAAAVHVSPSHQFPTGAVMPAAARSRLINWASETGAYIIEDDYDSEFRLDGKPLQSLRALCPERVIYINTFSKSLAPSMRLGYMVLPPELHAKYLKIFGSSANVVPLFEQKTLAAMLQGGYFERHISRLKNRYRAVRKILLSKMEEAGGGIKITDTGGGPHFTIKLKSATSAEDFKLRAATAGVNIKCLSDYLLAPYKGAESVAVINYSGITEEQARSLPAHIFG